MSTVQFEQPYHCGHEPDEVKGLTDMLEERGVCCFLVGISALVFYGAERVQSGWEICIPSNQLEYAIDLLCSDSFASMYLPVQEKPLPQPASLAHTYYRFSRNGVEFVLVPSYDVHIECGTHELVRSSNGVPYPTLPILVQTFIDTNDVVALCDIIDGTNISEEWGNKFLELDGTNDVEWAKRMNEELFKSACRDTMVIFSLFPSEKIDRRLMWESRVRGKKARLGWTHPENLFDTRFRLKDSNYLYLSAGF